ncbi:MAG: ferredoxin reductase [Chloroflexota bacterium]
MDRALSWQIATVKAIKPETPRVKSFTLSLPSWTAHVAGQHYDLRLTAPDGYQAQRSYSVASEPERVGEIDIAVERIENGEASTYLHDVLVPGDQVEVRGPVGGYSVWEAKQGGPLLLIAGGSGVVPLMAMLRHRRASASSIPAHLLYSARSAEELIYFDELAALAASDGGPLVSYTLTRAQPPGWLGYARRVDLRMLSEVATPLGLTPRTLVCGPTLFVEAVASGLLELGTPADCIRTERFGPTGGSA